MKSTFDRVDRCLEFRKQNFKAKSNTKDIVTRETERISWTSAGWAREIGPHPTREVGNGSPTTLHLNISVTNLEDKVDTTLYGEKKSLNVLRDNVLDRRGTTNLFVEGDPTSGLDNGNFTLPH